ncbi:MAG: biotin--[acetyl-CoA-carboxylase] ligase [Isosphaeraceae bacterium]
MAGPKDAGGWPFVEEVVFQDEVVSTSDLARDLASNGRLRLPAAVHAARQTRGRGRGTNAWWSDEGSLTATLILDPAAHGLRLDHQPRVALAVAVAVAEAVEGLGRTSAPVQIRWPNDVEAGGRKLAGILPERIEVPEPRLLIGVGVNVSTRLDEAPPEVRGMSTSLNELLPEAAQPLPSPSGFLRRFLLRLEKTLPRLAADDPKLAEHWSVRDSLLGETVRVNLGNRVATGVGRGIDAEGALLLDTGGETLRVFGGQVLRGPG